MPRDSRLFMTFPIDIHRHPKFRNLSAEAKWTFVEMNGEARIAENDGRFTAEDAEFMWTADALHQLTHSHPTRPVVTRDGTDYIIRDYAEHQFTKADREALTEKRARAGRASANARRARAEQVLSNPEHPATGIGEGIGITPSKEGGTPDGPTPYCKRHPEGTDKPCTACKRARIEFDAQWERELRDSNKPTVPEVRAPKTCPTHLEYPIPCPRCAEEAT